jgi:hypothetical protein
VIVALCIGVSPTLAAEGPPNVVMIVADDQGWTDFGFMGHNVVKTPRLDSLDVLADATKMARALNLPEEEFLKLRNATIACLALPDLRIAKEWTGWPAGSGPVDFDGRLEHYARTDAQGAVSIRRVAGDEGEAQHRRELDDAGAEAVAPRAGFRRLRVAAP